MDRVAIVDHNTIHIHVIVNSMGVQSQIQCDLLQCILHASRLTSLTRLAGLGRDGFFSLSCPLETGLDSDLGRRRHDLMMDADV